MGLFKRLWNWLAGAQKPEWTDITQEAPMLVRGKDGRLHDSKDPAAFQTPEVVVLLRAGKLHPVVKEKAK